MNTKNSPAARLLTIDELDRDIVRLTGRINAGIFELLVLIRQFDERAGWLKWGLANCAEWLHWRCDLSMSTAREKVRVAHEGGFRIERDYQDRWFFKRPDGLAVPNCGYRAQDMH